MKLVRVLYLVFLLFAVVIFFSVEISPINFWFAGLLSFGVLPCIVINIVFIFYFILRSHYKYIVFAIVLFAIGYKQIERTIQFNFNQSKGEIKVLNSNVRIFNMYKHLRDKNRTSSKKMIDWIANNDADVLILQEYYNSDTSKIWNTTELISRNFPFHHLEVSLYNRIKAEFGQVIFSKYPIINSGVIEYENKTFNQAIFADIVFKSDTIRIYNIHLQSMAIEERKLFDDKNNEKQLKNKLINTSEKLMRGFKLRTKQIEKIIDHFEKSPYPIILGADMNDTPYSYAYNEFSKRLINSYEQKGSGFGFTFNGKLFFLRIDNLFSSEELITNSFKVHRDIPYSDHFPISATYTIE